MNPLNLALEFISNPDDIRVSCKEDQMQIRAEEALIDPLCQYLRVYGWHLIERNSCGAYSWLIFRKVEGSLA